MARSKFFKWVVQILVCIDQFFHVVLWGPHYLFFGGEKPLADETISSKVGRYAIDGYKWALILEKLINFPFALMGDKNHCRKRIERFGPPNLDG
jgi:hypothetical protein